MVSIILRDGNPSEITKCRKIWWLLWGQELRNLVLGISFGKKSSIYPRIPKRFAAIAPVSCIWLKRLQRRSFQKNVTHKPLKLNPRKDPRLPSHRVEQALDMRQKSKRRARLSQISHRQGLRLSSLWPVLSTGLTGGEAGSMAGLAGPLLHWESSSISYLACVGVSMTFKWRNKVLGGQTNKWGTRWS
jgi:hypothetical protein